MSESTRPPKLFLSHASEDKAGFVLPLAEALQTKGIETWLDVREIRPGDSLVDKIFNEGLAGADAFVVVVSNVSVNKPWVRDELDAATVRRITEGRKLIPVLLDGVEAPEAVKDLLGICAERSVEGAAKAAATIAATLHGRPLRPPAGAPPPYAALPPFPGISNADSTVLIEVTREAIGSGHLIALNWHKILPRVLERGVDEMTALESLEALEREYLVEFTAHSTRVTRLDLSRHGYRTAVTSLVEDHDRVQSELVAKLVNDPPPRGSATVITDFARDVGAPELVVEQILTDLEAEGHLSYGRFMGGASRLHSVSSTLKRLLG